ncbi:MAG TPA: nitronate monooxygenase [Streptosporangiaceae bacterium]
MLRTGLTERFSLSVPIVSAPMAGVAGGRLAAAVSAAGGLGMIGVGSTSPAEKILAEAEIARKAGGRFGIGLMAWALPGVPGQFDATVSAAPDLVSVSFGDYQPWANRLHEAGIAVATQVGDVQSARSAAAHGVDLIVARGAEAGGHGHDRAGTLPLLQAVLDAVDVPVLAAGGIATARGLAAVLAAGAAGAWLGTALMASTEAATSPAARQRLLAADETSTIYTRVFDIAQHIAWPPEYGGRALANEFTRSWAGREEELAADETASTQLAAARERQDYQVAGIYAGQGVGMVTRQRPAGEVVAGLAAGAEELLRRWA